VAVEVSELARAVDLFCRGPHLTELLENFLLILWGDADTGVTD
jgi:hypothetical protein